MSLRKINLIEPKWPAPSNICACTTTIALGDFAFERNHSLMYNRKKLKEKLLLPNEPSWITQVHGNTILNLDSLSPTKDTPTADGTYTQERNRICCVITADCLPILICSTNGLEIAALHAGWRGSLAGIIENGIAQFKSPPQQLMAWLGPAISAQFFIVGDEIYNQFILKDKNFKKSFSQITSKHFHCDLYEIARLQLQLQGITKIHTQNYCTYKDKTLFYSYRRQNEKAGRIATLIWRK